MPWSSKITLSKIPLFFFKKIEDWFIWRPKKIKFIIKEYKNTKIMMYRVPVIKILEFVFLTKESIGLNVGSKEGNFGDEGWG